MTDGEINKKLASFMGYGGEIISEDKQPILVLDGVKWRHWNPLNNISDTFEVEEKIAHDGLTDEYSNVLIKMVGADFFYIIHATPRQRSLAAIKVIDDK
jgi:hypothetical protein